MKQKYFWVIIPAISFIFLYELILYNKIPLASDMVAHEPIKKWVESTSEFPHWFPNLFSGMPSYGGYIYTPGHPLKILLDFLLFNTGVKLWFFLSIGGLGLYFFLRFLKVSTYSSLFAGIAYSLTPYVFGLIGAGHNNKIMAGGFIPWIVFAAIYLSKYPSIKSVLFLSITSALQLWTNHPQIFYYTWMVIGLWWLLDILFIILKKQSNLKKSINNIGLILLSLFISLLMVSDPYYDIYTFQNESNRGALSVLDGTNDTKKGTKWDYATQWSFHPYESISLILPYYYGLQNFSIKDKSSPEKFMKQASYWGYMPFTQSTHYLGLLVIIFSFFSLWRCFIKKSFDKTELILWIITIAVLVTGFGSHFSILYKPLFKFAPFFSKFRVPSMIYMMLSLLLPMIAAIGLDKLINKKYKDTLLNDSIKVFGIFILLFLTFLFVGDSLLSFSSSGDARFPQYVEIVKNIRMDLFNKGAVIALFISSGALFSIWLYFDNRISEQLLSIILILILVADLWLINNEFLSLKSSESMGNQFIQTKDIKYLKNDNSKFRVFPADEINSNKFGYWNIESIGGYHAVKLRHYQDLMDAGGFRRPVVLNMLNVKYIITGKKIENKAFKKIEGNKLYENIDVLPRSWVVKSINSVSSQKSSLSSIMDMSFRPNETATVLDYDGPNLINSKGGDSRIIKSSPNEIIINCITDGGGLLILSEVFYKPGWKCKIDGRDSKIYQTNHVLRSVYVPDGEHEVVFYYDSSNWQTSRLTSRASFFLAIFFCLFLYFRERESILKLKKS